jgi:hypothetical protein
MLILQYKEYSNKLLQQLKADASLHHIFFNNSVKEQLKIRKL